MSSIKAIKTPKTSKISANAHLENIYRRYARVRIDALIECHELLKVTTSREDAIDMLFSYIKKNAHIAYEDKLEPLVQLNKRRSYINHISVGSVKGL